MNTEKSFFEQLGGTYTQVGDVLLPNLTLGESESRPLGKYGRMRKRYLKEQRPVLYTNLLVTGDLFSHLAEIDQACEERLECIIRQMKTQEGVTEALKAVDQMEWVRRIPSAAYGFCPNGAARNAVSGTGCIQQRDAGKAHEIGCSGKTGCHSR